MQGEAIISALIGLVGACNNNPKTAQTDRILIKALALCNKEDGQQELIEEIRAEKYAIAPDCAVCKNPCGNTSDYGMDRLYAANDEVRETKLQILSTVRETAELLLHVPKKDIDLLYKALLYVGGDLNIDLLRAVLEEMRAFQQKIEKEAAK